MSGTADVLELLGVAIEQTPEGVAACLRETGIGFCFARTFHPAFRFAGPPRAQLGVPTVFNLLGPMANPARVKRQLIGVADPASAARRESPRCLGRAISRHDRQIVTGLVVNDRVALPRATRRWLRAVEHHVRTGAPASLTEQQLDAQIEKLEAATPLNQSLPGLFFTIATSVASAAVAAIFFRRK